MTESSNLHPDLDLELAGRYVTDAASPEERRRLEEWMTVDPARRMLVAQLEATWRHAAVRDGQGVAEADSVDLDAQWLTLRQAMGPTRVVEFPTLRPKSALHAWRAPAMYAAAAAIVVAIGGTILWRSERQSEPWGLGAGTKVVHEYATPRGQRREFRLPDGTQVLLGVESRLRVPVDYGRSTRDVYLVGEAYFTVQHDHRLRFLVHTPHAVTEDLGTQFAVRAYPADTVMQVVVAEGRVALRAGPGNERNLEAGQLGRVAASGDITLYTGSASDMEHALAWVKGRLEFLGTPLREALPEMSRWFDLDFRLGDSTVATRRLTGAFRSQPNDQMLEGLARTLGLRVERRGHVVTFYDDAVGH